MSILPTVTWGTPTALELARKELADAERNYLAAQSAAEYAQTMAAYHRTRITRLQRVLDSKIITKES